jgi:hypothetical protein
MDSADLTFDSAALDTAYPDLPRTSVADVLAATAQLA